MAKDALSFKIQNGVLLDRILSKMQQSVGTKIVYDSLKKGAAEVRKTTKKVAPKDTGQLRKNIKSSLRRKVKTDRHTFMAAVAVKYERTGKEAEGIGGWYNWFVGAKHKENAFGSTGGKNFMAEGLRKSKSQARKTIGEDMMRRVVDYQQKELNKLK